MQSDSTAHRCRAALVLHHAAAGSHVDLFVEPPGCGQFSDEEPCAVSFRLACDPRIDLAQALSGATALPDHRLAWSRLTTGETRVTRSGDRCECLSAGSIDNLGGEAVIRFALPDGATLNIPARTILERAST